MMIFLMLLAVLAGLVAAASFVWLLVLAFRESVLWGLALLFLPFAPIVFAVKYWSDVKKPFLINLGASAASVVLFFGAGVAAVGMAAQNADALMAEASQTSFETDENGNLVIPGDTSMPGGEPVVEERIDAGGDSAGGNRIETPVIEPSSPRLDITEANMSNPVRTLRRPSDGRVPLNEVDGDYVGTRLRVVARDGLDTEALLTAATTTTLTFERQFSGGGTVAFDVARGDVESIHVVEN